MEDDDGGRELKSDVLRLLLILLLMLLDEFVVDNDDGDVMLEYGEEHKDVRFLFIAELILLPMEPILVRLSSIRLSSTREWYWGDRLSILREEDVEFPSELFAVL